MDFTHCVTNGKLSSSLIPIPSRAIKHLHLELDVLLLQAFLLGRNRPQIISNYITNTQVNLPLVLWFKYYVFQVSSKFRPLSFRKINSLAIFKLDTWKHIFAIIATFFLHYKILYSNLAFIIQEICIWLSSSHYSH